MKKHFHIDNIHVLKWHVSNCDVSPTVFLQQKLPVYQTLLLVWIELKLIHECPT